MRESEQGACTAHGNRAVRVAPFDPWCGLLAAAAALMFAACSGTIPGLARGDERPSYAGTAPPAVKAVTRPAPAFPPAQPPPASFPAPAPAAVPPSPAPAFAPPTPLSPEGIGGPASTPMSVESGARDRQNAILTDAVAALRQELARSFADSEELEQETKQLKAQISRLRSELTKSREENQALKNQIRTLEKRLREIRTPAPESKSEPEAASSTPPATSSSAPATEASPETAGP